MDYGSDDESSTLRETTGELIVQIFPIPRFTVIPRTYKLQKKRKKLKNGTNFEKFLNRWRPDLP